MEGNDLWGFGARAGARKILDMPRILCTA